MIKIKIKIGEICLQSCNINFFYINIIFIFYIKNKENKLSEK